MRSRISFITRTAKGGISYRHVDLDSDFVRFGRSTNNEIYLKDPRVPLDLAELHERPNGFFVEASGSIDLRHGGAITRAVHVEVGDTVALGPFDLVVVEPPEGFSVAATVELTRPLGDDLEELTARSTTSIVATGISRRRWAVGLFLLVIVLFAAVPLVGVFSPSIHQASLAWPVSVDIAWEPGQLSRPHDFFGDDCSQCHAQPFAQVRDQECLTCHEDISRHGDPVNYVGMGAARCANCHEEHNGWRPPLARMRAIAWPAMATFRASWQPSIWPMRLISRPSIPRLGSATHTRDARPSTSITSDISTLISSINATQNARPPDATVAIPSRRRPDR